VSDTGRLAGQVQIPPSSPSPAPLTVFCHYSGHGARPGVHVYYHSWVLSREVAHLSLHELPKGPGKGKHWDP
jgi:hypothetical protein